MCDLMSIYWCEWVCYILFKGKYYINCENILILIFKIREGKLIIVVFYLGFFIKIVKIVDVS